MSQPELASDTVRSTLMARCRAISEGRVKALKKISEKEEEAVALQAQWKRQLTNLHVELHQLKAYTEKADREMEEIRRAARDLGVEL